MDFVVVEDFPGELSFLRPLPGGVYLDYFSGVRRPAVNVIHYGTTGDAPTRMYPFANLVTALQLRRANPPLGLRQRQRGVPAVHHKWTRGKPVTREAIRQLEQYRGHLAAGGLEARGLSFGYAESRAAMEAMRQRVSRRSIYLASVFAMLTAAQSTNVAEMALESIGPVLVDKLDRGVDPILTQQEAKIYWRGGFIQRSKNLRSLWKESAKWLRLIRAGKTNDHLRQAICMAGSGWPKGLAMAKGSFALELLGHNVGCMDRWMLRYFLGAFEGALDPVRVGNIYAKASAEAGEFNKTSNAAGRKGQTTQKSYRLYRKWENRLKKTPYYLEEDPMAFARAQWTLWEDMRSEPTTHAPLFRLLDLQFPDPETEPVGLVG